MNSDLVVFLGKAYLVILLPVCRKRGLRCSLIDLENVKASDTCFKCEQIVLLIQFIFLLSSRPHGCDLCSFCGSGVREGHVKQRTFSGNNQRMNVIRLTNSLSLLNKFY